MGRNKRKQRTDKCGKNKILLQRIVITALFAACVAYIWFNSMQNAAQSSARSGHITELINEILSGISKDGGMAVTELFVRKFAHFAEYSLEGVLTVLLFLSYNLKPVKRWWAVFLTGFFTASVDESIQLYSVGRSAALIDVGIDMCGFLCSVLFLFAAGFLYSRFKRKV